MLKRREKSKLIVQGSSIMAVILLSTFLIGFNNASTPSAQAVTCNNQITVVGTKSTGYWGQHSEASSIDNNFDTYWSSKGVPSWIQYNLGSSKVICGVDVTWYRGNSRIYTFTISVSADGQSFTQVFSGVSSGTTGDVEHYMLPTDIIAAQFVRITVTKNTENQYASIREVHINGYTSDSSTMKITTGNSVFDKFDNAIINEATSYMWLNPMLAKAEIMQESWFSPTETTLTTSWESVCGIPSGWTKAEAQSLGLYQITPACRYLEDDMGMYPSNTIINGVNLSGRPIMVTDATSPWWSQSLYNGNFNVHFGLYIMSSHFNYFKQNFPTCNENQWMLMSFAAYSQGRGTVKGCDSSQWSNQDNTYVTNILGRYSYLCGLAGCPTSLT